jgi:hypothetical protein
MKIYGGHDYYDGVMALGADPSIRLMRKNEEIDPKEVSIPGHTLEAREGRWSSSPILKHIRVVFGPKIYHGVEIDMNNIGSVPLYFWDAQKLNEWVSSQKNVSIEVKRDWSQRKKIKLEEYFAVTDSPAPLRDYMIANRYAILLKLEYRWKDHKVLMNPHDLKKYWFQKALDPFTAYQELSMWVGGVLCGQSPNIVEITDDKTILEGHGFDNVVSFRGPRI